MTPDDIALKKFEDAAYAFAKKYFYLQVPDAAVNQCGRICFAFRWDKSFGKKLTLKGHAPFPEWHEWHKLNTTPAECEHVVIVYRNWTVDFTMRQFRPRSPFPFFQPLAHVIREWKTIKIETWKDRM